MGDLAYWARKFFQAFFLFSFEVGFLARRFSRATRLKIVYIKFK